MLLSVFMCYVLHILKSTKERHIYEALIMWSWSWIKKRRKEKENEIFHRKRNGDQKEKKTHTHNVITELRWKDDSSFPVQKSHGNGNHVSARRKRKPCFRRSETEIISGRVYEIREHVISSCNIIRSPILFQYIIWWSQPSATLRNYQTEVNSYSACSLILSFLKTYLHR